MDPIQLSLSLARIAVRSQRLMVDFLTRRPDLGGLGDPAGIGRAFLDLTAKMIADPMSIAQMQLELWQEHVKLLQRTTEQLAGPTKPTTVPSRPIGAFNTRLGPKTSPSTISSKAIWFTRRQSCRR